MTNWKRIKIILIFISIIVTIWNFYSSLKNKVVINFVSFLSSLTPLILALYAESDTVYTGWNKFKAFFSNKTVSFESSFNMKMENDEDLLSINELRKKLDRFIKENEYKNLQNGIQITDSMISIGLKTVDGLKFKLCLYIESTEIDDCIRLDFSCQQAYRDIKNSWNEFNKIKDYLSSDIKFTPGEFRLSIDMASSKINPFYKVTLRISKPFKIKRVALKIVNEDMTLSISKNKIYVASLKKEKIDDVIKNYIPLTKVY